MTPAQILQSIRNQLVEASADFFPDTELYAYMWQTECEIAQQVECAEAYDNSTTTVASTQSYTIPSDCVMVKYVVYDGMPLKRFSRRDQDAVDNPGYGGSLSSGQPTHYYEWSGSVYLWPVPDDAKTLEFYYVEQPTEITASSTAFTVPQMFHPCIIDGSLFRCWSKDQDEGRANFHYQMYERNLAVGKDKWARREWAGGFPTVKDSSFDYSLDDGLV